MVKLSKQDKIEIFHLWQNQQVGPQNLVAAIRSTIQYLLTLINHYGSAILDRPYTNYSVNFKELAIKRVLVKGETIYRVALDLGLKSSGVLFNWLLQYRENGYNVVIKQRERPPHDQKRTINQAGKSPLETRKRTFTSAELEADRRERIRKKIERLGRSAGQEPQAAEIARAVTELMRELKVSVTFILEVINAIPILICRTYRAVITTTRLNGATKTRAMKS